MSSSKTEILCLPVVAVRNTVVFPNVVCPLIIGRKQSLNAIESSIIQKSNILVVSQLDGENIDIVLDNLYKVGTVSSIIHSSKQGSDMKVIVDAKSRFEVERFEILTEPRQIVYAYGRMLPSVLDEFEATSPQALALHSIIFNLLAEYNKLFDKTKDSFSSISNIPQMEDTIAFSDIVCSFLRIKIAEKQSILQETSLTKRLEMIADCIKREIQIGEYEQKMQEKVRANLNKYQKEHFLKEQIGAYKQELNSLDGKTDGSDADKYKKKFEKVPLTKEAKEKVNEEISRLEGLSSYSSETSNIKSYLDTVLELPWGKKSKNKIDTQKATEVLNKGHYGLDKVKESIIEYISVQSRVQKNTGAILCFAGPAGVGKTSLVKSIADAMGREYYKIALGGMRDEGEIRGHRKTYVGAFPGRIIQALKRAKTCNPVILLDEIDKISDSYKGDPAAALLEVLDPEQNKSFQDNYLEFGINLSDVIFIATANNLNGVSYPLLDRMDVIRLSGYTEVEKLHIANEHLFAKAKKAVGLKDEEIEILDGVFLKIIRHYTREAGVRSLEREISRLLRKVLKKLLEEKLEKISISEEDLKSYLGIERYDFERQNEKDEIGVVTGLAYTEAGGDILMIEAVKVSEGKGEIKTTGKLGEVMKESMQTALSYVQSNCGDLGISLSEMLKHTVHIHVPDGATPKDGPSAGVAITLALYSLFSQKAVKKDIAMTGEVSLRGKVLPIGGLKEKLMSAVRSRISTVLIPLENKKDLEDIPQEILEKLEIIPISDVKEALKLAIR